MSAAYFDLINASVERAEAVGIEPPALNPAMFPHQRHATEFALRQGRSALFLDTGLGKSICALDWARIVAEHTRKPVLILAPLGVVSQHVREAARFGIEARAVACQDDVLPGVNITNYDKLKHFKAAKFGGIVMDESSILKSFGGVTTKKLMAFADVIPFRLCCTATPAPNDHMELGQHAQFLGVMASNEMLTRWFVADQQSMGRYRLKRGGVASFWAWVASWARCISKPSDIGYDDAGYALPELIVEKHIIRADRQIDAGYDEHTGQMRLLRLPDNSATAIHKEKRLTAAIRAAKVAELVAAEPDESWLIWCDADYEAEALMAVLPDGAIEVRGPDSNLRKEDRLLGFADGRYRLLVTKPAIAGYGLNYQHCARIAFVGLSFSYESYYQAIRRCWRFGQERPVHVHVACADTEEAIWQTVSRKSGDHEAMKDAMRAAMKREVENRRVKLEYNPRHSGALPSFLEIAA